MNKASGGDGIPVELFQIGLFCRWVKIGAPAPKEQAPGSAFLGLEQSSDWGLKATEPQNPCTF